MQAKRHTTYKLQHKNKGSLPLPIIVKFLMFLNPFITFFFFNLKGEIFNEYASTAQPMNPQLGQTNHLGEITNTDFSESSEATTHANDRD